MAKRKRPHKRRRPSDEDDFDEVEEAEFDSNSDESEFESKASAGADEESDEDAEVFDADAQTAEAAKGRDFLSVITDTLKSAGRTAQTYAKVGVSVAELEKLRLQLKMAHAKLGETLVRCWDDAPDVGIAASDPAVKGAYKACKDLRRRIREIENKIRSLQTGKPEK